jgi:hypothetical protein
VWQKSEKKIGILPAFLDVTIYHDRVSRFEKVTHLRSRVDEKVCDFSLTIDHSKSSIQILWLLPENPHLETKRSNEGKLESSRVEKGGNAGGLHHRNWQIPIF